MDFKLLHLIANVTDACHHQPGRGPGHPPTETIRVVATLRRFLLEGTPWCGLTATAEQASGSTLRRCLARWSGTGLLAKVHALVAAMLRGHPDLILDTCPVRAKRGGDLTGPNPTDRGKRGTKYHVAVNGDGIPVPHRHQFGAEPHIHKRGRPSQSGLGRQSWPVERSNAWVLENRRLALRYDRLGFIIRSPLQAACI